MNERIEGEEMDGMGWANNFLGVCVLVVLDDVRTSIRACYRQEH